MVFTHKPSFNRLSSFSQYLNTSHLQRKAHYFIIKRFINKQQIYKISVIQEVKYYKPSCIFVKSFNKNHYINNVSNQSMPSCVLSYSIQYQQEEDHKETALLKCLCPCPKIWKIIRLCVVNIGYYNIEYIVQLKFNLYKTINSNTTIYPSILQYLDVYHFSGNHINCEATITLIIIENTT